MAWRIEGIRQDCENENEWHGRGFSTTSKARSRVAETHHRVLDAEGTERRPSRDDRAGVPKRVVERTHRTSLSRVRQLGDQAGSSVRAESKTKADDASRRDEDADLVAGGLEGDADDHDDRAEEDARPTSKVVGHVGAERLQTSAGYQSTKSGKRGRATKLT